MVLNCFQPHDLFLLLPSLGLILASILLYISNKNTFALILLILGAFGLRMVMAHLDPYLWDWDERYHAMVAKNLLLHPLMPTLYDNPILPYDFTNWTANHIWLHKQPLALWQIALSYRLFGIDQFTTRLPMVLEGTLMIMIIYKAGTILMNKNVAYLSALFYGVSFYALDFTTGGQATDHVDYALLFYVSTSVLAFLCYRQNLNWKWLILVGIFSGLAVLSKWLTGLLVYAAWFAIIITDPATRMKIKSYLSLLATLALSAAIFMPWQWYCQIHYPSEAKFEMEFNQMHLFTAVEGRAETKWYYLEQLAHDFGAIVPYIIGFALIIMWRYIKRKEHRIFIFSVLVIPYFIFSVLAATKMPAYCYVACMPIVLALGSLAWYIQQYIMQKKWPYMETVLLVLLVFISWQSLNLDGIAKLHTGFDTNNIYRINKVRFTDYFRKVKKEVPKDYVIFGAPQGWEIDMMYYTGNTCYPNIPDQEKYVQLKGQHIKMAILKTDKTPGYMLDDKEVLKISPIP